MKSFYRTEERVMDMILLGDDLLGEPFHLNGDSWGGFGCAGLQGFIHKATGACPKDVEIPKYTGRYTSEKNKRRMSEWLMQFDWVRKLEDGEETLPGDMLTFKTNVGQFHMSTFFGPTKWHTDSMISSIPTKGVAYSSMGDGTYVRTVLDRFRFIDRSA